MAELDPELEQITVIHRGNAKGIVLGHLPDESRDFLGNLPFDDRVRGSPKSRLDGTSWLD